MPGFAGANHSTISHNHINDANHQTNYYNCTVFHLGDDAPNTSAGSIELVSSSSVWRRDGGSLKSGSTFGESRTTDYLLIDGLLDLLGRIQQLLSDETGPLDVHLQLQLDSLSQTLRLISLAASVAESTPLARSLYRIARPNIEQCHSLLQRIFDMIDQYRMGLLPFKVWFLWQKVYFWAVGDRRDIDTVRNKLQDVQQSLDMKLLALKSYVATTLNRPPDTYLQPVSFGQDFLTNLFPAFPNFKCYFTIITNPPFNLKIQKIVVVDHLGRALPIPMDFCHSLQDINYLLIGYCQGRIGVRYIQEGDYQLIEPARNEIIRGSEVINLLEPETILEMSIILRQWKTDSGINEPQKCCPRCMHPNAVTSDGGWREVLWTVCNLRVYGKRKKRPWEDILYRVVTKRRRVDQQFEEQEDPREDNVVHINTSEENISNETQFFRRIHIHVMAKDIIAVSAGPSSTIDVKEGPHTMSENSEVSGIRLPSRHASAPTQSTSFKLATTMAPASEGSSTVKSVSTRPVDLPRQQAAGKGGCWTCRLRRKRCDEQRESDSCRTCIRLKIRCLGWGPKRPEWMRDRQAVDAYKAGIKAQLMRQGLIRGQPRPSSIQPGVSGPVEQPTPRLGPYRPQAASDPGPSASTQGLRTSSNPSLGFGFYQYNIDTPLISNSMIAGVTGDSSSIPDTQLKVEPHTVRSGYAAPPSTPVPSISNFPGGMSPLNSPLGS